MATEGGASASTSKKDSIDVSEAVNHLIQGKRHMLVSDYASAVSSLQSATEMFAEKYGEMADECGEAYFNYGKALLELARLETGVLGNALDGVPEEDEEEDEKESDENSSNDDQVENPDKLSAEEQEKISEEVNNAIEENSRELDTKVEEWKTNELKKLEDNKTESGASALKESSEAQITGKNEKSEEKISNDKSSDELAGNKDAAKCDKVAVHDVNGDKKVVNGDENVNGNKENVDSDKENFINDKENDSDKENINCDKDANDVTNEDEEENEDDEDGEEKEVAIEKSPENNEGDEDEPADEEEKEDKEEEVTNLQLAWEIIELAKIIFERQSKDKPAMKLRTADAYLKLGEIAIESGNYQQAIEDLNKCLKSQQEELKPDDRLIAETHYQLGLAFSFNTEFNKGIESFEGALDLIKTRITNLETQLAGEESAENKEKIEREIKDLHDIIPEIKSKIEDTVDMKKNAAKAQADAVKEALAQQKVMAGDDGAGPSTSAFDAPVFTGPSAFGSPISSPIKAASSISPTKTVTNINHLVRKKRKADDNSSQSQLKKICSTETEGASTNQTNGTDKTTLSPKSSEDSTNGTPEVKN